MPKFLKRNFDQTKLIYFLSWLVPAATVLIYFIIQKNFPLGNHTILTTDLGQQYIDFYSYYRRVLLGHPEQFLYSFSSSLGSSTIGTWSYYLLSPFNLIILLTPGKWLPFGVWLMIIVKIGLCGLTMYYYLRHRAKPVNETFALGLAVAYALCGYNTAYQLNVMWLDGVYLLPLLLGAIELVLSKQKWWSYFVILALALLTNFYIGYMLCLFSVLYFSYLLISQATRQTPFGKTIASFGIGSILAGTINAAILLPTFLELRATKATYNAVKINWNWEYNPLELLGKLTLGSYTFDQMSSGQANIFTGSIVLILALIFFFVPTIKPRQKITAFLMTAFLVCSFCLEPLDLLWHGGQFPVWYPARFSFIFSAWLIILASEVLTHDFKLKTRQLSGVAVLLVGWLTYLLLNQKQFAYFKTNYLIGSIVLVVLSFCLIVRYYASQPKRLLTNLLLLTMIGEAVINYQTSLKRISYTNQSEYWNYTGIVSKIVNNLPEKQTTGSRLEKTFNRTNDDAMQFGYAGGGHFNSMQNPIVGHFYDFIGQAAGDNFVNYKFGTQVTDSLLGFKTWLDRTISTDLLTGIPDYAAGLSITSWRPDVQNYQATKKDGAIYVRRNKNALNTVFAANKKILTTKLTAGQPILNQERVVADLLGQNNYAPLFTVVNIEQTTLNNLKRNAEIPDATYTKINSALPGTVTFSFTPMTNNSYYLSLGTAVNSDAADITVNGESVPIDENFRDTILLNVARRDIGKKIEVTVSLKKPSVWLQALNLYQLDQSVVNTDFKSLKRNNAEITQMAGSQLTGTVTIKKNQLLMTTIPYDKGWQVYVDGQQVKTTKAVKTFLAAKVKPGRHQIHFVYRPQGWRLGWLISGCTALILLAILIFSKLQRKKRRRKTRRRIQY
ncbi:YfhO family protein [Lapidilactobacillus bayanensis]|uniref:YfhO family protein n=1 Tax=Lapidilactobacillus bayanensis TaxID=2485998 RepID=UPI000F76CE4D|nr:YfhO family protein [Lapidilactobacillus bayanensis]